MRKALAIAAAVLVVAILAAVYFFHGRTYVLRFSEQQLQEKLDARLPLTRTYLLIFTITLDHPRVSLRSASNRVGLGIDAKINIRVADQPETLGGSLDVSGGVKYVADRGQIFLTDPLIEHISIQGIPDQYAAAAAGAVKKALSDFYAERPLYTLSSFVPSEAATRLVLKDVVVQGGELVVTLGI